MTKIATPDGIREMTAQEQANYDARQKRYADQSASIKLNQIRSKSSSAEEAAKILSEYLVV